MPALVLSHQASQSASTVTVTWYSRFPILMWPATVFPPWKMPPAVSLMLRSSAAANKSLESNSRFPLSFRLVFLLFMVLVYLETQRHRRGCVSVLRYAAPRNLEVSAARDFAAAEFAPCRRAWCWFIRRRSGIGAAVSQFSVMPLRVTSKFPQRVILPLPSSLLVGGSVVGFVAYHYSSFGQTSAFYDSQI